MRKRYKQMTKDEFIQVVDREWVPVVLIDNARPDWMKNIPEDTVDLVLASGTFIDERTIKAHGITYSGVVGGIDIFRSDEKDVDIGFPFNKDHYIVMRHPHQDELLLVAGPIKDDSHWLAKLPNLDPGIDILEFRGTILELDSDD